MHGAVIAVAALAGILAVVLVVSIVLAPRLSGADAGAAASATSEPPAPTYAAQAALPPREAHPAGRGIQHLASSDWLDATAAATGIPRRALAAYAGAALRKHETTPGCGLGWNTLAGLGYVESRHGSYGGATILASGTVSPAIYGVSLTGATTARIRDSDDGKLDGDAQYDRAIGPMQMIPQTWRNWAVDGSGDGRKDPQNMDDEVLAAANYLCRASPDMAGVSGWRAGIRSYNSAGTYLAAVATAAVRYGAAVG